MVYCQQMGVFSYQTSEISADKNFVFSIAAKIVAVYDARPSAVSLSRKTTKKTPLRRSLLSLQRAEFVSSSAKNLLNGIPGHTGTLSHISTFLL